MKRLNFKIRRKLMVKIDSRVHESEMVIGGLAQKDSGGPWGCHCIITGIMPKKRIIYGEDQIQAVLLAFSFCAETLIGFNHDRKRVWWLESGDKGGLTDFKGGSRT